MTRVPTYATYMSMLNQSLRTKSQFELYNWQSVTGLKAPTYSGYGHAAYSVVNLEASLGVTSNFLENNKLLDIELKAMNTAMQSVNNTVADFKAMLNNFSGSDAKALTPDYTGGKITFTDNNKNTYLNKTITINGTQYTFADNGDGNNIDLSGIADESGQDGYAAKVMEALKNKLGANPEYKFEGGTFEFPLYTIDGASSVLKATGVETGEPYTMNQDQAHNLAEIQNAAFSALKQLVDSLNIQVNGKYLFGGGETTQSPLNFPFSSLDEFQKYFDGINIRFPSSSAANLSNRVFTAAQTGALTITHTDGNNYTISPQNNESFLQEVVTASAESTGKLTFAADTNTLKATQYGAFRSVQPGDTMVIKGTQNNNVVLTVKSVSEDGKTITFEENPDASLTDEVIEDPTNVVLSTTYPIGAVIEMQNMGSGVAPRVQVTGVDEDGTLHVTADPGYFNEEKVTVAASSKWQMGITSYFEGGNLKTERRISENQSVVMDVTANDPAFEKLFRALGQIAQGNLVDMSNPAETEGIIDVDKAQNIVQEAVALLQSAIDDSGGTTRTSSNSSLYAVSAKLNANYVLLNSATENLTLVQNNLQTSLDSIKNVNKEEAAVKALLAQNSLAASYSVLQNALNMSLLNYLD